jgi:hypothetical protein
LGRGRGRAVGTINQSHAHKSIAITLTTYTKEGGRVGGRNVERRRRGQRNQAKGGARKGREEEGRRRRRRRRRRKDHHLR